MAAPVEMKASGNLLHDATMSDVPARRMVLAALFALALCVWCG